MYDRHYAAPTTTLTAPDPLTVSFPRSERLSVLDPGTEVILTLAFAPLPKAPDFFLVLFVNTPHADAITPFSEPGFAGSVAFFIHPERQQHRPLFQLPIADLIRRTTGDEPVTVTLVPLGYNDRVVAPLEIELTTCLDVIVSTVDAVYR